MQRGSYDTGERVLQLEEPGQGDDLVGALDAMLAVRDKFDYVLVETTGLADPEPVARYMLAFREDVEVVL